MSLLGCLPLFHTFGQTCCMNTSFYAGASVVLLPRFNGADALELLEKEKCTIFMGVPTMYIGLLEAAKSSQHRPTLKSALSGGAALPVPVLEQFAEVFGTPVSEGYGLTETSPVATFNQKGFEPRPGTVGKQIWGVEVEIAKAEVEEAIELLPHGELGEIVVRGHNVFQGYLNKPEATAAAIVDGWFRTGDLGTLDDEGYVTIVDRKKDMVLRGGYNVYPREVEEALLRHEAVAQVAVIALPDPQYGEEVCAVVVREPDAEEISAEDLTAWAKTKLAAYKYPPPGLLHRRLPARPVPARCSSASWWSSTRSRPALRDGVVRADLAAPGDVQRGKPCSDDTESQSCMTLSYVSSASVRVVRLMRKKGRYRIIIPSQGPPSELISSSSTETAPTSLFHRTIPPDERSNSPTKIVASR